MLRINRNVAFAHSQIRAKKRIGFSQNIVIGFFGDEFSPYLQLKQEEIEK
jgi:hypothetical protein